MKTYEARHYLVRAEMIWDRVEKRDVYPFDLQVMKTFHELSFHPKVTFFVGENGSGKSTLIEALAIAWGFNPEGGSRNFNFITEKAHAQLHQFLRLVKGPNRAKDGYFLRAESYFNVASNIDQMDRDPDLTHLPPLRDAYGGKSLHHQSNGESFFALLEHRLRGKGLYIFDEPEAALSPSRQLSMLVRMHDLLANDSQFIIATHSPILMAYPDAWIYQIGKNGIERVSYEDTEHYQITKTFLSRHTHMLEQLLK